MRRLLVLAVLLAAPATAAGRPPPEEIAVDDAPARPLIEGSSWVRLGYGARTSAAFDPRAREVVTEHDRAGTWDGALGAEVTLPISDSGNVRVGPWIELRPSRIVAGGELVVRGLPRKLDLFHYVGTGIAALRVGGTPEHGTLQIAYGYSAPWALWGPWRGPARYMIGARLVGTYTRAHDDPRDWSATLGVEFEPVGALRYILGVRSWY